MLVDVLKPSLKVVFCGTAAGTRSAKLRQYYAGSGNKFWKTLHEIGLTPETLSPSEFRTLLKYGIGLTDLVKEKSGSDSKFSKTDFDIDELFRKIEQYAPKYLCFNGKRAAQEFLKESQVDYGLHEEGIGNTKIFIAPSTSGAASGHWNIGHWQVLAELCHRQVNLLTQNCRENVGATTPSLVPTRAKHTDLISDPNLQFSDFLPGWGQWNRMVSLDWNPDGMKEFVQHLKETEVAQPVILDLGCSTGNIAQYLSEKHGFRVLGFDKVSAYVQKANTRQPKLAVLIKEGRSAVEKLESLNKSQKPAIAFIEADFSEEIPLPSNSVDAITLNKALTMNPDEAKRKNILAEIFRVLKPGGLLHFLDIRPIKVSEQGYKVLENDYQRSLEILCAVNNNCLPKGFVDILTNHPETKVFTFVTNRDGEHARGRYNSVEPSQLAQKIRDNELLIPFISIRQPRATIEKQLIAAGFNIIWHQEPEPLFRHKAQKDVYHFTNLIAQKPEYV